MSAPETGTSRRALTWALVGLGVALVAGGGALLFLLTGGDEPIADVPPTPPVAEAAPDDDTPLQPSVAVTYDILLTRDPFAPIRPPEPTPTPPSDDDTPSNGNDTAPSDGDDDVPPSTSPADLPVIVYEVSGTSAVVQVGDVIYDASVGETFASRYRLEAIVSGCARIRDVPTGGEQVICPTTQTFK
jgi:hypothetical protein